MRHRPRLGLVLPGLVFLAGCSFGPRDGGYYADDGPPRQPPLDVDSLPEPVPKVEPFSASGNKPYKALNKTYYPLATQRGYRERGIASWYGKKFHGRRTSSGESYDMHAFSAAHKTLPLPCYARVTNLKNGKSIIVRVNDRGPFLHNRLIDLSYAAAGRLGIMGAGTGLVEVEAIDPREPPVVSVVQHSALSNPQIYVQLGAYTERENAERERNRLEGAGFRPFLVTHQGQVTVYRLRVGPLANVGESDAVIASAVRHRVPDAHVVIE